LFEARNEVRNKYKHLKEGKIQLALVQGFKKTKGFEFSYFIILLPN